MTRINVEFYQLVADDEPDVFAALAGLAKEDAKPVSIGLYARELWDLSATSTYVRGQLRKFRMDDLPEIGALGGKSHELKLREDQGLVEKNFFVFHKRGGLLVWHGNHHASTPNQFAKVASELLDIHCEALPILQGNAIKRLMAGDLIVRNLQLSVARPSNPDYIPESDFSQHMLDMLSQSEGDRVRVHITTDARINPRPQLTERIKRALKELVTDNMASVARIDAIEDGMEHPIDLIADRVTSTQEVDYEGRYPPAETMYGVLDTAEREERGTIHAIVGKGAGRVE